MENKETQKTPDEEKVQAQPKVHESARNCESAKAKEPAFLAQYRSCYPGNKRFYVTSDRLVFLEKEYKQAQAHQKRLGKGELSIY